MKIVQLLAQMEKQKFKLLIVNVFVYMYVVYLNITYNEVFVATLIQLSLY